MNNTITELSTKQKFDDAKKILDELRKYIQSKGNTNIASNPQSNYDVNQGIALADQPELVKDHLTEESALLSETKPKDEFANQETISAENIPFMPQSSEYNEENANIIQPEMSINQPINSNATIQIQGAELINNAEITSAGMIDASPSSLMNTENNQSLPDLTQNEVAFSQPDINTNAGELSQIPKYQTEQGNISSASLGVENVPTISISDMGQMQNQPQQTNINEQLPPISSEPVVMPAGTTPEMANDSAIVVGPDAFGLNK